MAGPDGTELTSYRRVAAVAWFMQGLIVLSGAAVRLTQAGLGCEDWPRCNDEQLLPEWELHGLIEFGNRLISGVVVASAIVAVVAARRLRVARPDLARYAWGLVIGTAAQVVLGGITVLADLHPIVVSVHFLVSMFLLWTAEMLWIRAGEPGPAQPRRVRPVTQDQGNKDRDNTRDGVTPGLARLQLAMATIVLLTGTVVTGTGPNSGDSRAERLSLDLTSVARIHSVSVWVMTALVVALAWRLAGYGPLGRARLAPAFDATRLMVLAVVAQGAVGYTQFALGVPPLLVELHILGAIVVWTFSILVHTRVTDAERPRSTEAGLETLVSA